MTTTYAFASRPKAVGMEEETMNIMSDPRVVRGSTYSLYRGTPKVEVKKKKFDEAKAYATLSHFRKKSSLFASVQSAVEVMKTDESLDLTPFLVEKDRVATERDVQEQTDPFVELPPPLPYEPHRHDVTKLLDKGTSMDDEECPFDFDDEVRPLLDVLVGKTLEQALLEVNHEDELRAIQQDTTTKLANRQRDIDDVQAQLENTERSFQSHKAKVIADFHKQHQDTILLRHKVAIATSIRNDVLPDILTDIFTTFEQNGTFVHPVIADIRKNFLPTLFDSVATELAHRERIATDLLDDIIHYGLTSRGTPP